MCDHWLTQINLKTGHVMIMHVNVAAVFATVSTVLCFTLLCFTCHVFSPAAVEEAQTVLWPDGVNPFTAADPVKALRSAILV